MGIFNKLFGNDDPLADDIEETLEENPEEEKNDSDDDELPYNVMLGESGWPYEFEQTDSEKLAGREILARDKDKNAWAGKYVRDLIESRRYRPKDPTRVGYAKDEVRGVQDVYIDHEALFKHMAMFGVTGYGKSTVMRNVMLQWIHSGYGLCFVDPKGEDGKKLIRQMPPHRLDDIVYVEPGGNRERMVGFNIFDTQSDFGDERYEAEVTSVAEDFRSILKDVTDYWGPRLDNVTKTIITQLIRAEEPYNPVDMTKILTDEEEMKALVENYGDNIEKTFLERVEELNQDELNPVLTRLQKWVGTRTTRQMMAHEESNINISEIVQDGKILVVNTSNIQQQDAKMIITRTVISRIWSSIQTRGEIPEEEREPFYLCIDEFDKVVNQDFDINDIISQARAYKLGVYVTNQQPSQLPDNVLESIQQVGSLLSFNPGNSHRDASDIAQAIGDVETYQISEIDPFTLVGRPMMNGKKQDGMFINTFAEYPYLRDEDAAEEIIEKSLDKYGVDPNISTDMADYGVKRYVESEESGVEVNDEGDKMTEEQLLECVYAAQLRNENETIDGKDDWVEFQCVTEELNKYVENDVSSEYGSNVSNIFERFTDRELERTLKGEKPYVRLGNKGSKRAFTQDTGNAASGGKSPHRILLREGHKAFTKLGYSVQLPEQEGGEQPDGLAEPPIKPMEESSNFDEAVEKEKELVNNYPRLSQLFGDNPISIEAESTTISRPAQTIKNLVKALKDNKHCVFLVKDGTEKHDEFEYWARVGSDIFTDPPFVRSVDENNNRTFYTASKKVRLSNGGIALVERDAGEVRWQEQKTESEDGLILTGTDRTEPLAKFSDASELLQRPGADPDEFPYHYYRDNDSRKTIVKDSDGNIVEKYENMDEFRADGRFKTPRNPIIPEYVLPEGKIPDRDQWTFVIIPDGNSDKGPQLYEGGDMEPLLVEDGARIDPREFELGVDIDIESVLDDKHLKPKSDDISIGDSISTDEPIDELGDFPELDDDHSSESDPLDEDISVNADEDSDKQENQSLTDVPEKQPSPLDGVDNQDESASEEKENSVETDKGGDDESGDEDESSEETSLTGIADESFPSRPDED